MASRNAAQKVWPDIKPLDCWFHVLKAFTNKTEKLLGVDRVREAEADLSLVQLSWNESVFQTTSGLFMAKYKKDQKFLDYIKPLWFGRHASWFEGAAPNLASTNNALEGFNRDLKEKVTKRTKLAVGLFMSRLLAEMQNWSKNQFFREDLLISRKTWQEAWRWAQAKVECFEFAGVSYYPLSSTTLPKKKAMVTEIGQCKSFGKYKLACQLVRVTGDAESSRKCTCKEFQKADVCRHVLGLAVLNKEISVPMRDRINAADVDTDGAPPASVIFQKARRGRPPKIKKALQRD